MNKLIYLERDFQELFEDLHASGLWEDGKEISDAITYQAPEVVLEAYRAERNDPDFNLRSFFGAHFSQAPNREVDYQSDTAAPVEDHINKLWSILSRIPESTEFHSSLIRLPHPYIVPGGRFNEIYYWDSYFTMLGLIVSGHVNMVENMVKNFAWMIDQFGFIPNGNRSYYLGRSQPPFFSLMVTLLSEEKGEPVLLEYLPALEKEHAFWMEGEELLGHSKNSHKRIVQLSDGAILNRHYDNVASPRAEMYSDDIELISSQGSTGKKTLLNIRAACESGWDFSSRWCAEPDKLETIRTTDLVQVDLNCLLFHLEDLLARAHKLDGNSDKEKQYLQRSSLRKKAIQEYFWNEKDGYYYDFNWVTNHQTSSVNAAAAFPLFFNLCNDDQASRVARVMETELLMDGGLLTTNFESGQQWDAPNGWAPLQWMAIKGLRNYGLTGLAEKIKNGWVNLNIKVFKNTGKLMEKYNVVDTNLLSGGGEYPVQDGFGWTNGVLLKLLSE